MDKKYDFNTFASESGELGKIIEIHYPIVHVSGLPSAKSKEMVLFENGELGEVFSLQNDYIQVSLLSRTAVPLNTKATVLRQAVKLHINFQLKAMVIDPLGNPLTSSPLLTEQTESYDIFAPPQGLASRRRIKNQLLTGVRLVDFLLPIGMGQKQLLIGDRKTGKRQFALNTAVKAVRNGNMIIYAAIGQNHADIQSIWAFFVQNKITDNVLVIASTSVDSPSLIYLTPYVAMAAAEFYKNQGINTVIIFDDLTTHAQLYRELSLLGGRFPGRESYPGDIFYAHSSLLERAGNFIDPNGNDVSITCLPIIHTIESDFTSYISTNTISITDGHLYFDRDSYLQGNRPAIHTTLSVTRAGKQTQSPLLRDVNHHITTFLSEYNRVQNYTQFGAELNEHAKSVLLKGSHILMYFHQTSYDSEYVLSDLLLFGLIWNDHMPELTYDIITKARNSLNSLELNHPENQIFQGMENLNTQDELNKHVNERKDLLLEICEYKK